MLLSFQIPKFQEQRELRLITFHLYDVTQIPRHILTRDRHFYFADERELFYLIQFHGHAGHRPLGDCHASLSTCAGRC
jgi:hypothetical protein